MLFHWWRRWSWWRQRRHAEWDLAHYRNGVATYQALVKQTEERIRTLDAQRVELEAPAPRCIAQTWR